MLILQFSLNVKLFINLLNNNLQQYPLPQNFLILQNKSWHHVDFYGFLPYAVVSPC